MPTSIKLLKVHSQWPSQWLPRHRVPHEHCFNAPFVSIIAPWGEVYMQSITGHFEWTWTSSCFRYHVNNRYQILWYQWLYISRGFSNHYRPCTIHTVYHRTKSYNKTLNDAYHARFRLKQIGHSIGQRNFGEKNTRSTDCHFPIRFLPWDVVRPQTPIYAFVMLILRIINKRQCVLTMGHTAWLSL
jgi:hypothetical protein